MHTHNHQSALELHNHQLATELHDLQLVMEFHNRHSLTTPRMNRATKQLQNNQTAIKIQALPLFVYIHNDNAAAPHLCFLVDLMDYSNELNVYLRSHRNSCY